MGKERKILHMTLKRRWYHMILFGKKREEYREIKPYWDKRFDKNYDIVRFKNGYNKSAPFFDIELKSIKTGVGRPEWGAPKEKVYILELGNIIKLPNN